MRTLLRTLSTTSIATLGLIGLASAQVCPPGFTCESQPAEVQVRTLGPGQIGPPQESAFFTRFDTMGGTRKLLSVRLTTDVTVSYTARLENKFLAAPQVVTVQGRVDVKVEDFEASGGMGHIIDLDAMNPGNEVIVGLDIQEGLELPAFDGAEDFAGPSGTTISDSALQSAAATLTDPMDLARFTIGSGAGTPGPVQFLIDTVGPNQNCMAAQDAACSLDTLGTVVVTVEYIFCLCMPEEDCKCINRREPGSLLLFPEFNNTPGNVTVFTVTNTNCDFFEGGVDVEFRYIDGDNCLETNQKETLTPCDTITLMTSAHAGHDKGYAYAYARNSAVTSPVNPAGTPIVFNHLVGSALVVNGWQSLEYSINAVSFKAIGNEGASTDKENPGPVPGVTGDGIRDFDGFEYEEAPDKILIPRFLGQDPVLNPRGLHSDLILVALSGGRLFEANQVNPGGGTTILIHGWNDNEIMFSLEHTFDCWQKLRLGLLQSPDLVTPVPGTMVFDNTTLDDFGNDPMEIAGANGLEQGWFWIDGLAASSSAETISDPAVYAVLIETIRGHSAADLPFEYCSQPNGDLLPGSIFGDFNRLANPPLNNMDDQ